MGKTAYIALGSNIGDGKKNILRAVEFLSNVPLIEVEKVSDMYITKPWGGVEQSDFVNACAKLKVNVTPETLLGACLGIEAAMGRIRKTVNGPRIMDIDLLLYEDETRNSTELVLPHPRMFERDFVLVPLLDVADSCLKNKIRSALDNINETYVVNKDKM